MKVTRLTVLMTAFTAQSAWASGGGSMPWDKPLQMIAQDLSGPTVVAIAIIAMVVSAMVIAFEGGLPEWGKKLAILALAVSVAVGASSFLLTVFNVAGGAV